MVLKAQMNSINFLQIILDLYMTITKSKSWNNEGAEGSSLASCMEETLMLAVSSWVSLWPIFTTVLSVAVKIPRYSAQGFHSWDMWIFFSQQNNITCASPVQLVWKNKFHTEHFNTLISSLAWQGKNHKARPTFLTSFSNPVSDILLQRNPLAFTIPIP